MSPDVIVAGGGVIGAAVSYYLTLAGMRVRLLEADRLAGKASGAAAGMLAPRSEGAGSGALRELGLKSLALFPSLVEELQEATGLDAQFCRSGICRVALTEEDAAALAPLVGDGYRVLSAPELAALCPGIHPGAVAGFLSEDEGHVVSPLLARAFAQAAAARGADVREGVAVLGVERRNSRVAGVATTAGRMHCPVVVVCAGAWSGWCLQALGVELPVRPIRGQILSLRPSRVLSSTILWSTEVYMVPKRHGLLTVGATEEDAGFDCRVTANGVRHLLAAAIRTCPELAHAELDSTWAGLRPATPDHLPLIGPAPQLQGLVLATGHYRNGVLLSPVTGMLVRDHLTGADTTWGSAVSPARLMPPTDQAQ